jgi:class 3 adenylate cyclase
MKGSTAEIDVQAIKPFEALQELNRSLIKKVSQQTDLIERMSRLKRYLSPQLADYILKSDDLDPFKSHRREITAIFLDLRGFTAFSDSAEPEEVIALLRSYHAEMGKLIFKFGGTVEHFVADGLMVFFNDPVPCQDHTEKAVRLSMGMRDRVKELRTGWLQKGYDLDLGIGLAAGYAAVGNIGFEGQLDYSAVGNVTNLASRLCGAAKGGQILTDQKTLTQIDNLVQAEPLEELHLKGFVRPVRAFDIVSLRRHVEVEKRVNSGRRSRPARPLPRSKVQGSSIQCF